MAANQQNSNDAARRVDVSDTTAEVQPPDPYTEPPNSTVDDWFGQEADRDAQAAEQAMEQAGGDPERAEKIFDETRPEHESQTWSVPSSQRP